MPLDVSDFFHGIVLGEMATGQRPFAAENLTELIENQDLNTSESVATPR